MSKITRYEQYSPGLYGLPHMGEVFADYRTRAGWSSQEAFAIVCGVEKQAVVYWENQKYLTDMDRRILLCKLLKIPPALLGLTWRSVINETETSSYIQDYEHEAELLKEDAYGLYEDVLAFAHTGPNRYSPIATYKFRKHQQELERLVQQVPQIEKDAWKDLLSRYYQHSAFIAQHHKNDDKAVAYINAAVDVASSVEPTNEELIGVALYKRARVHMMQNSFELARQNAQGALKKATSARSTLKGNAYLLNAEVNALYAQADETLKTQCRKWQDLAANLLYKKKVEADDTFLWFDLYAVHHERAKVLTRFSLFHSTDDELVEHLKETKVKANIKVLKDAQSALEMAKDHLDTSRQTALMDCTFTESRILLANKEFAESAKMAKSALSTAQKAHSQQGVEHARKIYKMLNALDNRNPYISSLGVDLGIY